MAAREAVLLAGVQAPGGTEELIRSPCVNPIVETTWHYGGHTYHVTWVLRRAYVPRHMSTVTKSPFFVHFVHMFTTNWVNASFVINYFTIFFCSGPSELKYLDVKGQAGRLGERRPIADYEACLRTCVDIIQHQVRNATAWTSSIIRCVLHLRGHDPASGKACTCVDIIRHQVRPAPAWTSSNIGWVMHLSGLLE